MTWTWWQRGELVAPEPRVPRRHGAALDRVPDRARPPWRWSTPRRAIRRQALAELQALAPDGWEDVASDQTEGVSLALAAAACSVSVHDREPLAAPLYEAMRPYAGTAVVVRAPAAACLGPADHYLGLLAETMGDLALAEVHHEAALRLARRMGSPPFVAAAEVELARTLRQRRPAADEERVAVLLRNAEESARAHGAAPAGAAGRRAGLTQRSGRRRALGRPGGAGAAWSS